MLQLELFMSTLVKVFHKNPGKTCSTLILNIIKHHPCSRISDCCDEGVSSSSPSQRFWISSSPRSLLVGSSFSSPPAFLDHNVERLRQHLSRHPGAVSDLLSLFFQCWFLTSFLPADFCFRRDSCFCWHIDFMLYASFHNTKINSKS